MENHKESTRKKVGVVWACDEKRGTLRRKKGVGNESTWEKEERKTVMKVQGRRKRRRPKRRWLDKVKDDIREM